ncbi:MAG: type II 3-dehydroquinate dehydratase [Actinomycetes bacterium]
MSSHNRIEVMHGVNLDQLGRRPAEHYGSLSLDQLEQSIEGWAHELGLNVRFFRSNHEGDFVEHLHRLEGVADGVILNPGAWTHYAWAIRDALEITGLPSAEVHLSDLSSREEWRQVSVLEGVVSHVVSGKGPDGYKEALSLLASDID